MAEQHHHHHHHHKKDGASRFKERSLNAIVWKRKLAKWLKILLIIIALLMVILLILAYTIG